MGVGVPGGIRRPSTILSSGNVAERAPLLPRLPRLVPYLPSSLELRKPWSPVYVLRADSVSPVTRLTGPSGNRRVFKARSRRGWRHGNCLVSGTGVTDYHQLHRLARQPHLFSQLASS